MEFKNLKSSWKHIEATKKSKTELEKMTQLKHHPVLNKIRLKLIIETIALSFLLFIYYDWFDGNQKPLYANLVLILGILTYITTNVISYVAIKNTHFNQNLKDTIHNYIAKIKRLSLFSICSSIIYTGSFLFFFSSVVEFNLEKKWILFFGVIVLIQAFFWSHRVWKSWIKKLSEHAKNLC